MRDRQTKQKQFFNVRKRERNSWKIEIQTNKTNTVFNERKRKKKGKTDKQDRNSFLMKERGRERERQTNKTEIVF